ncbi:Uncharacterised protein [Yersinia mollaretii]|nr:Uncharacterised protein [Yersinia mollaretii]
MISYSLNEISIIFNLANDKIASIQVSLISSHNNSAHLISDVILVSADSFMVVIWVY